ncbi:MAG: hypothetical protein ACRDD1_02045 [Planctomycetia bacterium]
MSTMAPPVDAEEGWLQCRIDKGMFSDELAVTYPADGEGRKSVFVSKNAIDGTAGQTGKVRIKVVRRNGALFAVLPSSNQDIVTVRDGDLSS